MFSHVSVNFSSYKTDHERIIRLREEIIHEKTLNNKQEKAFQTATDNTIKRYFKEETEQLIAYIGGPGGTGCTMWTRGTWGHLGDHCGLREPGGPGGPWGTR